MTFFCPKSPAESFCLGLTPTLIPLWVRQSQHYLDNMEEFVAYIVKNLVDDSESVKIRAVEDNANETIKLEIRVAPEDIGKIIGHRGNTIHALRTILRRVCARLKKKVQVDLVQPDNDEVISSESFSQDHLEPQMKDSCCASQMHEEEFICCGSGRCHSEEEVQPVHTHGCCQH